jgi:hypothetical protein
MAKLQSGKYLFSKGKINKIELNRFKGHLFEVLIFIAFILSFTLELLLFYSHVLQSIPFYENLHFLFNVLFLGVIYSIIFGIVASFILEMKNPQKKDRFSIKHLIVSLIFFNFIFVISVLKDYNNLTFSLLDYLLYFTIFTSGVFIIGIIILRNIIKSIKNNVFTPSRANIILLKISSASIGIVIICSIILLLDTTIIAFSGNIIFRGQTTITDIWEWEQLALSLAIIGAGIGIAGVIVWKRHSIFGGGF